MRGAKTAAGGKTGTGMTKGRRFGLYSIGAENPKLKFRIMADPDEGSNRTSQ
jgi:hypothetical protein